MQRWDAIIVGAGPAGCAAAYDLAVAGRSVLLLDRADFPRPKACAGGLTRKSLRALRYSVAPVTRTTVSSILVAKENGQTATLASRNPVCAMTVRQELDDFCLRQTLAVGAQFQRIGNIAAIETQSDHVILRTNDAFFEAQYIVGADGVHSRIRQLLWGDRPAWLRRGFALEAQVFPENDYRSGLLFDFSPVSQGYGWIFPKRDHLNIGLYSESPAEKIDRTCLAAWIRDRCGSARVEQITGQYLGFGADQAPPAPGRIFLAGDAGGFADPLTGEGIHGAIASGQAAAAAIDTALREGEPADRVFTQKTAPLRRDLRLSASGSRWFYANLDAGFRALTTPFLRGAVIGAYADGTRIGALAGTVRKFTKVVARSSPHDAGMVEKGINWPDQV
jgi:geranylgeranyl reductase family protein